MTLDKLDRQLRKIKSECKTKGIVDLSEVSVEVNVPAEGDPEGCLTGISLAFDYQLKQLMIYPVCSWKEK